MVSILTTSESSEHPGTDPFADFDGVYSIHDDEPNRTHPGCEPSNTSSDEDNDTERSQHEDYDTTETGEAAQECEGRRERGLHLSRVWRVRRWLRGLLRCF